MRHADRISGASATAEQHDPKRLSQHQIRRACKPFHALLHSYFCGGALNCIAMTSEVA